MSDIHGQTALLARLLDRLALDAEKRGPIDCRILILGDLIDRGSGSAQLLTFFSSLGSAKVICLLGNHEKVLLDVYEGNLEAASVWFRFGGWETLEGFGADPALRGTTDPRLIVQETRRVVPAKCVNWLRALPKSYALGDYFFVHAGVRPRVPIEDQDEDDLLWIRSLFLNSRTWHGAMIVHGHSPTAGRVEFHPNRICVDTGAYSSGKIAALALEGKRSWTITG